MKLGEKWQRTRDFEQAFHRFHLGVELALVAGIVWFVWTHVNRGRQASDGVRVTRESDDAAGRTLFRLQEYRFENASDPEHIRRR